MTDKEIIKALKNYKYDRAIDLIRRIKTEETHERCNDRHKAFDLAINALEKQIPEAPYLETPIGAYDWYFCPNCNHNDVEYKDKYCRRCGQALDWRK